MLPEGHDGPHVEVRPTAGAQQCEPQNHFRQVKDPDSYTLVRKETLAAFREAVKKGDANSASILWQVYKDVLDFEHNGGEPG